MIIELQSAFLSFPHDPDSGLTGVLALAFFLAESR
jgi:hypothetical protein